MSEEQPKMKRIRRGLQIAGACLSFAAGFVLGPYAEELLARAHPGFFGPDNQSIIEAQQANFAKLDDKFEKLKQLVPDDGDAQGLMNELGALLTEQQALSARKDELFQAADAGVEAMKAELLEQRGVAGAVDFWVKVGESLVLKDPDKVFSVLKAFSDDRIDVNLSGERSRLTVGDPLTFQTSAGQCTLFFRHGKRDTDGRFGFDLNLPQPATP